MAGTFHWIKIRLFCYATEDEERLHGLMTEISGIEDFDAEMSDGHHGNSMIILSADLKNDAECKALFTRFGKDVIDSITENIDERIDEDCTFYMRLGKQEAVLGRYEIAHHGDVISVTAKIVSHPARKEIAVNNMKKFLENIKASV